MAQRADRQGMTRREALGRGAVAATALVWVPPAVQLLEMTPASAEMVSAGPPASGGQQPPPTSGKQPPAVTTAQQPPLSVASSSAPGATPPVTAPAPPVVQAAGGSRLPPSPVPVAPRRRATTAVAPTRAVSNGRLPFTGIPVNPLLLTAAAAAATSAGIAMQRVPQRSTPRVLALLVLDGRRFGVEVRGDLIMPLRGRLARRALESRAGAFEDPDASQLAALATSVTTPELVVRFGGGSVTETDAAR